MRKREVTIFSSVERTATPTAVVLPTGDAPALYLIVEVTDVGASTPSVVFTVDLIDATSGTFVNLLTSAAVTTVSSNIYKISPALETVANLIARQHVPRDVRISATHADADEITYSVAAHLI